MTVDEALNCCESTGMRVEGGAEHHNKQSDSFRDRSEGSTAIIGLPEPFGCRHLLGTELCCHTVADLLYYILKMKHLLQILLTKHLSDKRQSDDATGLNFIVNLS